ncbi:hypothetical protein ZWY2020_045827 [Hordeum vulgare]|nr:hypothetical protein ZWY2020_045827 [Hordeum vulgare]
MNEYHGSKKLITEDELLSLSTNAPNDHLEFYLQYLTDMEEQNVAINSKIVSSSQQNSSSREGKDIYEVYSAADGVDFVNALANEDYIEMKDLLSSDSSTSTSEFSSRRSEEYFDSDALMRELLNDQNTNREIHQDCKHNIAGPTKSDCVVISPPKQEEQIVGYYLNVLQHGSKKLITEDELLSLSTNAPNDHLEFYLQYLTDMEEQNVAINSKIVSSSQQNSSSREGKDIYEVYSAADGVDFVNALANEDYIEMKDLLSSDSSTSTSEFSSRRSEEYFDSDALMRELLNDQNTNREIHQDCKHNIAGPTKSDCVVISPPKQEEQIVGYYLNVLQHVASCS